MKINYVTDIEYRAGGWYVVTRIEGAGCPAAEIGPLDTDELARRVQAEQHAWVGQVITQTKELMGQVTPPLRQTPPAPVIVDSIPGSDGGWMMRRFLGKE